MHTKVTRKEQEQRDPRPFIRFIFLNHDRFPEDPNKLMSLVKEANIVFLEIFMPEQTKNERELLQLEIDLITAKIESLDQVQRKKQRAVLLMFMLCANFVTEFIFQLKFSGKKVLLVDADYRHKDVLTKALETDYDSYLVEALLKLGNFEEAFSQFKKMNYKVAEVLNMREEVVGQQISDQLTSFNEQGINVSAVVIQGLIHKNTRNLMDDKKFRVESKELETFFILNNNFKAKAQVRQRSK